jgi:hypothetical protein
MASPTPVELWTAGGVVATAIFTGIIVVLAVLTYRQARVLAGHGNPIRVRSPRMLASVVDDLAIALLPQEQQSLVRLAAAYMFNHSDALQEITIDPERSRIIWPFELRDVMVQTREVDLEAHAGGNVRLALLRTQAKDWPASQGPLGVRCWLYLRAETASGHVIRRPVHVYLDKYE